MPINLDPDRRTRLEQSLSGFFLETFDEQLSAFRAGQILDHLLETLGPQIYNQAVQDARRFMLEKLEDLDGEVHQPEPP